MREESWGCNCMSGALNRRKMIESQGMERCHRGVTVCVSSSASRARINETTCFMNILHWLLAVLFTGHFSICFLVPKLCMELWEHPPRGYLYKW